MLKILFFVFVTVTLAQNIGYFWQVGDPHIDVDYKPGSDPNNCDGEIMCCRHFFANQTAKAGKFGETTGSQVCDTPHITIAAGFDFIKKHSESLSPRPDWLLMTGDYAAHDNEFQSEALNLEKVRIVSEYAEKAFGGIGKVFSTVGNHDTWPCDQSKPVPNQFYDNLSRVWAMHRLPTPQLEDIRRGGYYGLTLTRGLRLIVMNTQWTNEINFWLYVNGSIDHSNQLAWLTSEFAKAEAADEKILFMGHIPPKGRWPEWKYKFFYELINKHQKRVIGQFYGHQHSDNLKLMESDGVPFASIFVGGVLTAGSGKNSAVRLWKYDKTTFALLDYEEWIANIADANKNGIVEFKKGYTFTSEYGVRDVSVESTFQAWKNLGSNDEHWNKYMYNYRSQYARRNCQGECRRAMLAEMMQKP